MRLLLPAVLVIFAGLWLLLRDRGEAPAVSPRAPEIAPTPTPPAVSPADSPAEIFRRVFWKRPTQGDRILNSERREEKLADGRSRWRSFLEVEASPALVDYLRKENAFGMFQLAVAAPVSGAPKWFVIEPTAYDAFATGQGSLRVFFAKSGTRLFAVGEATSFTPGVPEPVKTPPPPSSETSSGRLPGGSPPGTR